MCWSEMFRVIRHIYIMPSSQRMGPVSIQTVTGFIYRSIHDFITITGHADGFCLNEGERSFPNCENNNTIHYKYALIRHYVKHNKDEGSAHDLLKLQQTASRKKSLNFQKLNYCPMRNKMCYKTVLAALRLKNQNRFCGDSLTSSAFLIALR